MPGQFVIRLVDYLHEFDRLLRMYRWCLRPGRWRRYRRWLASQSRDLPGDRPLVVFDFRNSRIDGPQGRRFYTLFMFFVRAGYFPVFVPHYLFLVTIDGKTKRHCLQEDFGILDDPTSLAQPHVLVTDGPGLALPASCQKCIRIDYRPDYIFDREGFPLPFPMFPDIYAHRQDLQVDQLRSTRRQWRVFFGGDAAEDKYVKSSITRVYRKLNRGEVLAHLRATLPEAQWCEPADQPALDHMLEQDYAGLLVMNTRRARVPAARWLETLAKAEFFLACPGVRYPMSHNLIESLALGVVPITEYPELFFPALQDGVNCLVYAGKDQLEQTLQRAMRMSGAEIQQLRTGAQAYYDSYLAPAPTIERLLATPDKVQALRLLPFLRTGGGYA